MAAALAIAPESPPNSGSSPIPPRPAPSLSRNRNQSRALVYAAELLPPRRPCPCRATRGFSARRLRRGATATSSRATARRCSMSRILRPRDRRLASLSSRRAAVSSDLADLTGEARAALGTPGEASEGRPLLAKARSSRPALVSPG
ncbi:uncharacterized protein J3R85_013629 [Psidium guajava]|nr:uncharacterized protein J3R85_013629 [Psidium guajava]